MVTNVTGFSRSGLSDFLYQRISAVVLALYALCVVGFFVVTPNVTYEQLIAYFGSTGMQLFTLLALLSLVAHAWVGMWTVGTDYIQAHYFGSRATVIRFIYQSGCVLALFVYSAWVVQIFWGLSG